MRKLLAILLATAAMAAAQAPTRHIAILGLQNLNRDPATDWIGAGIAETMVSKLSNVDGLSLVERMNLAGVMREQALSLTGAVDPATGAEVGKLVGADMVVTGAYQTAAEKLRITARFVDVTTSTVSGTADVTGKVRDIFTLQDKIAEKLLSARHIAVDAKVRSSIAANPTSSVDAVKAVGNGNIAFLQQDYGAALKDYQLAQSIDPNYAEARNNAGNAYLAQQQYDSAEACYREAIALKPEFAEAYNNLGYVMLQLKRYDEAVEQFRQALGRKPGMAMACNNLGIAYQGLKKYKEAVEQFEAAIRLNPKHALAHYNLAISYTRLSFYDQAVPEFEAAIKLKPALYDAYHNLAGVYVAQKQYDLAIEAYHRLLAVNPDFALAYYNLACIHAVN
ncbi:MAG TPA: FlgO family outer membrane protein, partial [Candidatus Edwardsbacteria bacterium]|nr:FlgO family outer membrane protein [Candidatus Edwardsbacteria bacterium]